MLRSFERPTIRESRASVKCAYPTLTKCARFTLPSKSEVDWIWRQPELFLVRTTWPISRMTGLYISNNGTAIRLQDEFIALRCETHFNEQEFPSRHKKATRPVAFWDGFPKHAVLRAKTQWTVKKIVRALPIRPACNFALDIFGASVANNKLLLPENLESCDDMAE